jgi:thioredoxin-like negative regulator of GroEL
LKITDWLGKKEFTELTNSQDTKIVLFAAKWCGYCTRFLEAARNFNTSSDAQLFLVDADDPDESLWDIYNLKLVPTLVVFKSGKELQRRDGIPGVGLRPWDLAELLYSVESSSKSA